MSVHPKHSQLNFQLPSLSYIDAKWEEPELRAAPSESPSVVRIGLVGWLSRRAAELSARRRNRQALSELSAMSDRELLDIGLTRSDIARVFDPHISHDLSRCAK